MKNHSDRSLRRLLCSCLVLALILFNAAAVYADDECPEEQSTEDSAAVEMNMQESQKEQPALSSGSREEAAPEPAAEKALEPAGETTPEPVAEKASEPAGETTSNPAAETASEPAGETTSEPAAGKTAEPAVETTSEPAAETASEPAGEAISEPAVEKTSEPTGETTSGTVVEKISEPAGETTPEPAVEEAASPAVDTTTGSSEEALVRKPETAAEVVQVTDQTADSGTVKTRKASAASVTVSKGSKKSSAKSSAPGTISIGGTSFSSEDEESSYWSDGKGWKNVAGKYVAMVDYDGSKAEISADSGVLTLAVAGVNRIKKLKGDCSVNIVGTGIVLIDRIEITDGHSISLMTDTSIYDEGSAAVFLLQDDGSYLLINGDITGILDEYYELDNVRLEVPKGSSLTLNAMGIRTETWSEDGSDEPLTEVTLYKSSIPVDAEKPVHKNGDVKLEERGAIFIIGQNSTLTVDSGASVILKDVQKRTVTELKSYAADLVIQGVLNIKGVVEGGLLEVSAGGSLTGDGTVQSAEVRLAPEAKLSTDLLLEKSSLSLDGNDISVSANIKDSVIYLNGSGISIPELIVSGTSVVSCITESENYFGGNRIGDITLDEGSNLEIHANDRLYEMGDAAERHLADFSLTISGKITGGTVSVLAGFVDYVGEQTDTLPVVPVGYASRVLVEGVEMDSTEDPINMTPSYASAMLNKNQIPVLLMSVDYTLADNSRSRKWVSLYPYSLEPLDRTKNQSFSCESLMEFYGLELSGADPESEYHNIGVEVIDEYLNRHIYWVDDPSVFSTKYAIMIRILEVAGRGGQGGSSVTHTSTSFTGNGVIGGPGSGSMQAGIGTVVYRVGDPASEDQEPDDTKPDDSKPDDSKPDDTKPDDTKPEDSKHDDTKPDDSKPDDTKPEDSKPDDTKPEDSKPDDSKNENENNNADNTNSDNGDTNGNTRKTARNVSNKYTAAASSGDELIVTISVVEPETDILLIENPDMPKIWHLDVTKAGSPVTDLTGNPVRVVFPFTVPEAWGDPAEIAEGSLYAVFADDDGVLTAYQAYYDLATGEIWFETEMTGDFVIVQFEYEEEPFTEEFYSALNELEDIRDFLDVLEEERETSDAVDAKN